MLVATDLHKSFTLRRDVLGRPVRTMTAVAGVSLEVAPGETLALVGESGCGKSTTAELVLGLQPLSSGRVTLDGGDISVGGASTRRAFRRAVQAVFQDPYSSLDPTQTVGSALEEALRIHRLGTSRADRLGQVDAILDDVGLAGNAATRHRYPSEFSGGQRQRIAIARALIIGPRYVVLDEAVSALDVSTQAQILMELRRLQAERGLGYLFISHDLGVVRQVATRVAVMYLGRIVEVGRAEALYQRPRHPYTAMLLASVLTPDPDRQRARRGALVSGEPPDAAARPSGCAFHPRCPHAVERCVREQPQLRSLDGIDVACHRAEEIDPRAAWVSLPTAPRSLGDDGDRLDLEQEVRVGES